MTIGPHLLGRKYVPDARDWHRADLERFAELHQAAPGRRASWPSSLWDWVVAVWTWFTGLFSHEPPAPPPPPPPPPSPGDTVVWHVTAPVLDQGNTPECVAFAWSHWVNHAPVEGAYTNADGHLVYREVKAIDGDNQDGSTTRSGATAMRNRGRLAAYAFALTVDEVVDWVATKGPVPFGSDWTDSMFDLVGGYLVPTGAVAGGHEYLLVGYVPDTDSFVVQNSWGAGWGKTLYGTPGRALIKASDLETLFRGIESPGDACFTLELP